MPAFFPYLYLLRPRRALLDHVHASHRELGLPWFAEPHVWSLPSVGDHDYEGQQSDNETFLKLIVLGKLHTETTRPIPEGLLAEMYTAHRALARALVTTDPARVEQFDALWSLERIGDFISNAETDELPISSMQTVEGPLERNRPSNILGGGLRRSVGERWTAVIDDRARYDAALIAAFRWVADRMQQEAPTGAFEKRCSVWSQGAVPDEDELRAALREDGWEVALHAPLRIGLVRARWLDDCEFEITVNEPRPPPRRGTRTVWRGKMMISIEQQDGTWCVTSATLVTTLAKALLP